MKLFFSTILLKICHWTVVDKLQTTHGLRDIKKCVLVAAPHSSNWDYFYCILSFYAQNISFRFLGKKSLFKFPMGILMRATGGIPVDRSKKSNLVSEMVHLFQELDELRLIIAAEGTRGEVKEWKSGFYHIAVEAKVPIVLGFLDYKKRIGGFHDVFYPTGDWATDYPKLRAIYQQFTPKNPKKII